MSDDIEIQDILHTEIQAKQSYDKILDSSFDEQEIVQLKLFREAHKRAISFWSKQSKGLTSSSIRLSEKWQNAVDVVKASSSLFGNEQALKILSKCEKVVLESYKKLLRSKHVTGLQKLEVINNFMLSQSRRVDDINTMSLIKDDGN